MLRMRIERAPLKQAENLAILEHYNRLTGGRIPIDEFVHWVRDNPTGLAWHGILETEEGRIVGHTSAFPLRTEHGEGKLVPAKSEYSFMHEDFRKEKILGFETVGRPPFVILLNEFLSHCQKEGWGPIFVSTNDKNQLIGRKVGLRPVEFPLSECLLVLKPAKAARHTPNLSAKQRLGLLATGLVQSAAWACAGPFVSHRNGLSEVPVERNGFPSETERLSFFEDAESLKWRYLAGQYFRVDVEQSPGDYVIVKRGSSKRFSRVCQWRLEGTTSLGRVVQTLVSRARSDGTMGMRWAVYDGEKRSDELVRQLRWAGFLSARRVRVLLVHKKDEKYLSPAAWKMNDSLYSFDP
jgi:hypothetical protein